MAYKQPNKLELVASYYKKDDIDKAIEILKSVTRKEDDKEQFAKSRFNLGNLLDKEGRVGEAIQAYEEIKREDDKEQFAKSRFNLGVLLHKQGQFKKAIKAYKEIKREDDKKYFAKSRFNLGVLLRKQGQFKEAIKAYKEIEREDAKEQFAKSRFNLGVLLRKQGQFKEAIKAYKEIKREDDKKYFAKSRFNLGVLLHKQGQFKKAIKAYEEIKRKDDKESFAKSRVNLGVLLGEQNDTEGEIKAYKEIKREDDEESFAQSRFNLGVLYESQNKIENAITSYEESDIKGSYHVNLLKKIADSQNKNNLWSIYKLVKKILRLLQIKDDKKIAHYTTPYVADLLLNKNSFFRLNSILGVNDPTEGKIVPNYFGYQPENEYATFVSCFTFNHDSLNQFRLYGKEKGEEASGVSVVLDEQFFDHNYDLKIGNIQSYSLNLSKTDDNEFDPKQETKGEIDRKEEFDKREDLVRKLPIYRCVYLEEKQGGNDFYLKLARREEITFFRDNSEDSSRCWKKYQKKIQERENKVKKSFKDINKKINKLKGSEKENIESILLPLRYLVKHTAFREEQECRMVYISTDLSDPKIKTEFNNGNPNVYVEYEQSVKDNLHKIYLSPGAIKYKEYFTKATENKAEICISKNPFRNKIY